MKQYGTEVEVQDPRSILVHQMPATNPESTNPEFLFLLFLRVTELKNNKILIYLVQDFSYKIQRNKKKQNSEIGSVSQFLEDWVSYRPTVIIEIGIFNVLPS